MAIFNPQVPDTQDPNYLGYSHPVGEHAKFHSSTGELLKAGGEILSGAIKGADEIIQAYAQDVTRQTIEPEQEALSTALTAGRAAINLQRMAGLAPATATDGVTGEPAGNGPGSGVPTTEELYKDNPDTLPRELKQLPGRLNSLYGGKASGALTETDYYARLAVMAKDLRARFPIGYRDYIDKEVSKITGVDPANAYIKSVLGEINSFITAKQGEQKEIRAQFRLAENAGIQGAAQAHDRFLNDNNESAARRWINEANAFKAREAQSDAALKGLKNEREGAGIIAERKFISDNTWRSASWFDDVNSELISKGAQRDSDGNWILDAKQKQDFVQKVLAKKEQFINFARMEADRPDKNGESLTTLMGPGKRNERLKELSQMYDDAADRITNDKSGQVGQFARMVKEYESNATWKALMDPKVGSLLTQSLVIRQTAGEQAAAAYQTFNNMPLELKGGFDMVKMQPLVHPAEKPFSPRAATEMLQKAGYTSPKAYSDVIDLLTGDRGLLSPTMQDDAKERIAAGIGDPSNRGFISSVKDEYTDSKGNYHTGKIDTWSKFTSEPVAKEVMRLGQKKGFIATNYVDWASTEFKNGLFQPDMQKLKDLPDRMAVTGAGVKFHWDREAHSWSVTTNGIDITGTAGERALRRAGYRGDLNPMQTELAQTVEHLNVGIRGLTNVAKAAGQDPNQAVLRIFQDSGFDLASNNVTGIPEALLQSIKNSSKSKAKAEEDLRNLR